VALIVPQLPVHETPQVTAVFALPVTVGVNCCVSPAFKDIVPGKTETAICTATRVTDAVAVLVLSALDVAVTVTVSAALMLAGAV
jgi:hypothetical protein